MMRMKCVLVVLNPVAGRCKGAIKLTEIISILQASNRIPFVLVTKKQGDAYRFAYMFGDYADTIICVGGDGTFSELVSGILEGQHKVPMGYIPTGSTNDYARSLELPHSTLSAVHGVIDGQPQPFDVGYFNGKSFAYVAAFGTLAKVAYSTPQRIKNTFGHFSYILTGIWKLFSLKALHVAIEIDEEQIDGDFVLGIISNATSIGGILRYNASEVSMNDGCFELMLIKPPTSVTDIGKIIYALVNRAFSKCDQIIFRRCKTLSVEFEHPVPWTLDGEYIPDCQTAEIRNNKNAIQVIMPSKKENLQ